MKKVKLGTLKAGDKFVYGNGLFLVCRASLMVINFTCGLLYDVEGTKFNCDTMVTPIKVLASDIITMYLRY